MPNDHRRELTHAPDPGDELISEAVREINRIYTVKTLETYLAIGRYLLKTFFDNDFEVFRSKGRSDPNMKALAARLDLLVSSTTLWRSVAVLEQSRQLPREVARELTFSHHVELLGVTDEGTRERLARSAVEGRWGRRGLRSEVAETRDAAQGRDSSREAARAMTRLEHAAKGLQRAVASRDGLQDEGSAELVKRLDRVRSRLEESRKSLVEAAGRSS